MNKETHDTTWLTDIFFLTLWLFCLFFALLGVRPLFTPDEGRYAEIAREMVERGDYITPYLNSIKYFEKPILYYWLAAASIKIGGLSVWTIRSVNALLSILSSLMTYITGRALFDRKTGLIAAGILPTSLLYFVMTNMISLDLPVTVFMSTSLFSFLLATHRPAGHARRLLIWLAAAMSACAVLTKGLIGIVLPGIIVVSWLCLTGEWRKLKSYYIPSAIILFLLIATPWHVIVNLRNPEFFHFYFIQQHVLRYATKGIGHYQPAWFFIPWLIIGAFPWIVFFPQAITSKLSDKRHLFFFLWTVIIVTFFSFSKSKLIPYILPIFPALAILMGNYLSRNSNQRQAYILPYTILLAAMITMPFILYYSVGNITSILNIEKSEVIALLTGYAVLIASIITALLISIKRPATSLFACIAGTSLFLQSILIAAPAIDQRSIEPMARVVKLIITPEDDVITYNQYYQDLPFYLERRVSILNWRNEMSYGMQHQSTSNWMIDDQEFWRRWHSKQRVFVFMSQSEYQKLRQAKPDLPIFEITNTPTNVVISNKDKPKAK